MTDNHKREIQTDDAPAAVGPYSQALLVEDELFVSGQIGLEPGSGEMVGSDVEAQARQVLKNLRAVVQEAGGTFDDVVKTNVYLASMDDYPAVNDVYQSYFEEPYPARACVEVSHLPKDAKIEIDLIARL